MVDKQRWDYSILLYRFLFVCYVFFLLDVSVGASAKDNIATVGKDYPLYPMKQVFFDIYVTRQTVRIPIRDDTDIEPTEYFQLELSLPSSTCDLSAVVSSAASSATLTIVEDDGKLKRHSVHVRFSQSLSCFW